MSWLDGTGWIVLSLAALASLVFMVTSMLEREWRAFWVTLSLSAPWLGGFYLLLAMDFYGRDEILMALLALGAAAVLTLLLPLGSLHTVRVVERQECIDERDAVFHRFMKLKPGDPELEDYYRAHPEKEYFDDRVRALPGLDSSDSPSYHPTNSPFQMAAMGLVAEIFQDVDGPPNPLGENPVQIASEEITRRIKGFARHLGADLVGSTRLNSAYVYSHIGRSPGPWGAPITLEHSHALAIGVVMSHEMVRLAPRLPTLTETAVTYLEAGKIAVAVARYLRMLGYEARAHVDTNYRVMCVPIAVDAGLGELGRHGLLITPRHGSRIRLSVVTTNLPLAQDRPLVFGVQHFCEFCMKCAANCPSGSIDMGVKAVYAGVEKWQAKRDTCYRYWRVQGTDCGLCIKVCPFSHPDNFMHNLVRWMTARNSLARRVMLFADDVFYGRRPQARYSVPIWHAE